MRHHYRFVALRLPGNVERELSRLQTLLFESTGSLGVPALPPIVPVAGTISETMDGCAESDAALAALAPSAPLELGSVACVDRVVTMDASMQARAAAGLPSALEPAAGRVLLGTIDADAASGVSQLDAEWARVNARSAPDDRRSTMTVRRVAVQLLEVRSDTDPWWQSVDWAVLGSVSIGLV
ncbi:MAG: hypothetical protein ACOC0E_01650 [Spirochaetota bacterium]